MKIQDFALERYFAKYEFNVDHVVSCSHCESFSLKEILAMADDESLGLRNNLIIDYTQSNGHPLLRKEIANLYQTMAAEQILVCTPEEGIFITMNCLLQKGDEIICVSPGYQSLYEVAQSLGVSVKKRLPRETKNGFSFDIDDCKKLLSDSTKLVVVNFPHNPTGATLSLEEKKELVALCKQYGVLLFSDEMYRFLEQGDTTSFADLYDEAITLAGMSKTFSMPGLRMGWLTIKNNSLYQKILSFKDYTTICNNAPSEILALMGLRNKENIVQRNKKIIAENTIISKKFCRKNSHVLEYRGLGGGSICFLKLNNSIDSEIFCTQAVEQFGVMILPSTVYGYDKSHIRIGLGIRSLKEGLHAVQQYIDETY